MRMALMGLVVGLSVPGWGQERGAPAVGPVAKLPDAPCAVAMPKMVIDRERFPVVRERKPQGMEKNACGVALVWAEGSGREQAPK